MLLLTLGRWGASFEEFQAIAPIGEDTGAVLKCDYASNIEINACINKVIENDKELIKELVETPNAVRLKKLLIC